MANNPLYPGYSPKKDDEASINPVFPGYYSGQPIQRRPISKSFIPPIEYNTDVLMKHIDDTVRLVKESTPLGVPGWIMQRIGDDFKGSLKATIKPTGIDVTELDDYNTEDLPGAQGISISLNPMDYIKDPKKNASKTLKSWAKAATGIDLGNLLNSDFEDIENKTRQRTWKLALGYAEKKGAAYDTQSAEAISDRLDSLGFEKTGKGSKNPMNLKGVFVDSYYDKKRGNLTAAYSDIYKKTVDAIGEFEQQRDSQKTRDIKHDVFLKEASSAANLEIQQKYNVNMAAGSATVKTELGKHATAVEFFDIKNKVVGDIGGFNYSLNDSKIGILKKIRDKSIPAGASGTTILSSLSTNITTAKTTFKSRMSAVDNLRNTGQISEISYTKFKGIMGSYESYLANLEKTISEVSSKGLNGKKAFDMIESAANKKTKLTGGDIFENSIERNLLANIEESMVSSKGNKNLSGVVVHDTIGSLFQDNNIRALGINIEASKLAPIAYKLRRDRISFATQEFLTAIDEGKFSERYIWNNLIKAKLPERLKAYLPSTVAENFLKSRNYFGLKIEKEGMARLKKLGGNKYTNAVNKFAFKVKLDESFYSAWGVKTLKIAGGNHFEIFNNSLLNHHFNLADPADAALLKKLLTGSKSDLQKAKTKVVRAQKLFGKNITSKEVLNNAEYKKRYEDFIDQIQQYKDWMSNEGVNLFGAKAKDPNFQFALFTELQEKNNKLPHGYKLDRQFIGKFEKVHMRLEEISTRFLSSKFGKLVASIQNWKDIVSNKVAKLISDLIAKIIAGAAATTGFLAVIMPIIERVIAFVIQKALGYGQAALQGLLKGDFKTLSIMMEKDVKKMLSCMVWGCAIAVAPFVIIAFFFYAIFSITVSPIDSTVPSTAVRCYENSNTFFSVDKEMTRTTTGASYKVTIKPGGDVGKIPTGTEITYSDYVMVIRRITNGAGDKEDVAYPLESPATGVIEDINSETVLTYDLELDTTDPDLQHTRIQNFFIISIPKIEGDTDKACYDQVIIASTSFQVGAAPAAKTPCFQYITPYLECEKD